MPLRVHWLRTTVTIVVSLIVANAVAQTAKIVGLGAATCFQFTTDIKKDPSVERDYLAWAQGFMSGILLRAPMGTDENLDLLPTSFGLQNQLEYLRDYCNHNTASDFSDAALSLYKKLREVRSP
jgi:hypothetical protein